MSVGAYLAAANNINKVNSYFRYAEKQMFWDYSIGVETVPGAMRAYSRIGAYFTKITLRWGLIRGEPYSKVGFIRGLTLVASMSPSQMLAYDYIRIMKCIVTQLAC